MMYLPVCAGWGAMIFSFGKSTSLEGGGGQKRNPGMIRGASKK